MSTKRRLNLLVMGYMRKEFSIRDQHYPRETNVIITQLLGNVFIDLANTALQIMSQNDTEDLHHFFWAFDYLCEITEEDDTEYQIKAIQIINTASMTLLMELFKHKNTDIHNKAVHTILTIIGSPQDTTLSDKEIVMKVKELQKLITFTDLLLKPENQTCITIDCNACDPQWASVNNGCFMCIKCAGIHRSMGVQISFVRSATMDSWTKTQLARMTCGGNTRLRQFWFDQKFPNNLSPKQRFCNEAMDKYREALLTMAKSTDNDTSSNFIKEIEFIGYADKHEQTNELFSDSQPKMEGFGNTNYSPNESDDIGNEDKWEMLKTWGSSFAQNTKEVAASIGQQIENVKKLTDEEHQTNFRKNASETMDKTAETLSSWWSAATASVTNVLNKNNEIDDEKGMGKDSKFNEKEDDGNSSDALYAFVEKIENEDKDDKTQQVTDENIIDK